MASGIVVMKWDCYVGSNQFTPLFSGQPLTFNSNQERLFKLDAGARLWLVSRCPDDQQYYFVGRLDIVGQRRNLVDSPDGRQFGEFGVIADPGKSQNLGKRFPAEGLLRAFEFETSKPIKYGANVGQSLQTIRLLNESDEAILEAAFALVDEDGSREDRPFGLWTKCDSVFADYFLQNWKSRRKAMAFLLYDPPPVLGTGAPVFIHSDKYLRLFARYVGSEFVAAHKFTAEKDERIAERERVWTTYRADTLNSPAKTDFDTFWEAQHAVRGLFTMDNLVSVEKPVQFKTYGHALQWGYPTGVGYRYLSLSQSYLLLRMAGLHDQHTDGILTAHARRSQ